MFAPNSDASAMKVVMVDDSAADRRLCRVLLGEVHGGELEFFEASDGAGGLETCRTELPDCVLLDYKLPDMTGLEFLAQLSPEHTVTTPKVAVVMLTGISSGQVAAEAMKAGAQDYLVKDHLSAEGLAMAVRKATEKVALILALKAERDRLALSVAEKEVLIQEVHHRVKNNLAVIASLLRLQVTTSSDDRLAGALRESQHRVESMALIHEQLYANGDLRNVDVGQHASLLAGNLFHAYGIDAARISWSVTMEALLLGVDQAIPVGLILNELISNALKHGFPNGSSGWVHIEGSRAEGRIQLTVSDNGAGVPPGVELGRPKSLGMQIIKILTRQLKGQFEVTCGQPATFRISFPEAESGQQILQSAGSGR
jgi:two-component sensor histidine kinase/CheY-like chemotaxis protein